MIKQIAQFTILTILTTTSVLALDEKASRSTELNVDSSFTFKTFQPLTLDLSVVDEDGYAVEGEVIRIYSIEEGIVELTDPRLEERTLIVMTRTDNLGRAYIDIELSNSIVNMMIETSEVGLDSKAIMSYDGQEVLSYEFMQ